MKHWLAAIACFFGIASFAHAGGAPKAPWYVDGHVDIVHKGHKLLSADLLLERNKLVTYGSLKSLPVPVKCQADATPPELTYNDGITLAISGNSWENFALMDIQYAIALPRKSKDFTPLGEHCQWKEVRSTMYSIGVTPIMKAGETYEMPISTDLSFSFTVKGIYDTLPPGRTPGIVVNP